MRSFCGTRGSVSDSLHPSEGIRLLLDRQSIAEDMQSASYAGAVYTVTACFRYRVDMAMDGSASLLAIEEPATPGDEDALSKIAKSTARAAKRKREEALPPWPMRILRWRGPGRG